MSQTEPKLIETSQPQLSNKVQISSQMDSAQQTPSSSGTSEHQGTKTLDANKPDSISQEKPQRQPMQVDTKPVNLEKSSSSQPVSPYLSNPNSAQSVSRSSLGSNLMRLSPRQRGMTMEPSSSYVSLLLNQTRSMSISVFEDREVQIQTSLEPFYPSNISKLQNQKINAKQSSDNFDLRNAIIQSQGNSASQDQKSNYFKSISVKMNLDKSAHEVTRELKQKLRVYNLGSGPRNSLGQNMLSMGRQSGKNNMLGVKPQSSRQSMANQSLGGLGDDDRDELNLYLFKTMASNKMLAFKKINDNEFPLRQIPLDQFDVLQEADGFDHILKTSSTLTSNKKKTQKRKGKELQTPEKITRQYFVLCFVSINQIEQYLKENDYLGGNSTNQHQQINQLSKSIMSGNHWERKGKLKKKKLNQDKFEERYFELEKDHLYYYKAGKAKGNSFTCIILSTANIRMYSSEQPDTAPDKLPSYIEKNFGSKSYYILEIQNESRNYVLAAKSHFDLLEWFNAIFAQIESLKTNKALLKNAQSIIQKEKEIANRDKIKVQTLVKIDNIFRDPITQSELRDFVKDDMFIYELLHHTIKYMQLADRKDYKQAYQKADDLMKLLREFHQKLIWTVKNTPNLTPLSSDSYKRYKTLANHERIACLITDDDMNHIEQLYSRMKTLPEESKDYSPKDLEQFQLSRMNRDLFTRIVSRLMRVLKHNYLSDFNKQQIQNLTNHTCENIRPRLGFNSLQNRKLTQTSLPDKEKIGKQANIFGMIARRMMDKTKKQKKALENSAKLFQQNNTFAGNNYYNTRNQTVQNKKEPKIAIDPELEAQLIKKKSHQVHADSVKLIQNTKVTKIRTDQTGKVPFVTNVPAAKKDDSQPKLIETGSAQDKA